MMSSKTYSMGRSRTVSFVLFSCAVLVGFAATRLSAALTGQIMQTDVDTFAQCMGECIPMMVQEFSNKNLAHGRVTPVCKKLCLGEDVYPSDYLEDVSDTQLERIQERGGATQEADMPPNTEWEPNQPSMECIGADLEELAQLHLPLSEEHKACVLSCIADYCVTNPERSWLYVCTDDRMCQRTPPAAEKSGAVPGEIPERPKDGHRLEGDQAQTRDNAVLPEAVEHSSQGEQHSSGGFQENIKTNTDELPFSQGVNSERIEYTPPQEPEYDADNESDSSDANIQHQLAYPEYELPTSPTHEPSTFEESSSKAGNQYSSSASADAETDFSEENNAHDTAADASASSWLEIFWGWFQ